MSPKSKLEYFKSIAQRYQKAFKKDTSSPWVPGWAKLLWIFDQDYVEKLAESRPRLKRLIGSKRKRLSVF